MKIILLIVVWVCLFGCSLESQRNWLDFDCPNIPHYEQSKTNSNIFRIIEGELNFIDINLWINQNIEYKKEIINYIFCYYPLEIIKNKKGDCLSKSILQLAIVYKLQKQKGNIIILNDKTNLQSAHAITEIEHSIYDPTNYINSFNNINEYLKQNKNYYISYIITFDKIEDYINLHRIKYYN